MKKYLIYFMALFTILIVGCNKDSDFLNRKPTNIIFPDDLWSDKSLVLSVIADFYNRYPDYQRIDRWWEYTNFDEGFPSAAGDYWRIQFSDYNYDWWLPGNADDIWSWDYSNRFLRDLNMFIQKGEETSTLDAADKDRFLAEARFVRAAVFFDLVKRIGGVPLILEPMNYDFSGDPTYLQHGRAKESEIYDFVISEMEAIKDKLPVTGTQSRATWGAALALEARAALYAASIAKYGASTPEVSLPGGEVGIPASMAAGYYQKALTAAEAIINSGRYSLYQKKDILWENFASLFTDKSNNPEVIFAKDYMLKVTTHGFTVANQPHTSAEEQQGGRLNPSLNLAQEFELLDNTFAPFATKDAIGNPIQYNNPKDIFAGRDARLEGTVMLPGTQFKGYSVDIFAGWQLPDGSVVTGNNFGQIRDVTIGGQTRSMQVVGKDGPIDALEFSAQTGFYIRKYLDNNIGSGRIGTQSDVWWIRYRFAEVLLNAAEAAFELENAQKAADYMNRVRARAGLVIPLTASQITFDRIVHERKVELAFEDHILWDKKRWRLAHRVWDGTVLNETTVTQNIGNAYKVSTMMYGLWPYKVYNAANPDDVKYIFKVVKPSRVTQPHRFRLGNYYSFINDNIRSNNPKIVRQPNQ